MKFRGHKRRVFLPSNLNILLPKPQPSHFDLEAFHPQLRDDTSTILTYGGLVRKPTARGTLKASSWDEATSCYGQLFWARNPDGTSVFSEQHPRVV